MHKCTLLLRSVALCKEGSQHPLLQRALRTASGEWGHQQPAHFPSEALGGSPVCSAGGTPLGRLGGTVVGTDWGHLARAPP